MLNKLFISINLIAAANISVVRQEEAVVVIDAPIVEEDTSREPRFYFSNPYTSFLINEFENNRFVIDISEDPKGYLIGLNEVCSYYSGEQEKIQFYSDGKTLEIKESDIPQLQKLIKAGWRRRQLYRSWLNYVTETHNFKTVEDIQEFVMDWFDYSVTNANMWNAVKSNKGQCWHYAAAMANLCQVNGFDAEMVVGDNHAWVVCDGVKYDPTKLDVSR